MIDKKMVKELRAKVVNAVSIYKLPRRSKDYMVSMSINDNSNDISKYYMVGLIIERILNDEKLKKKIYNDISFNKLRKKINEVEENGEDFFIFLQDSLKNDKITLNYFLEIKSYSETRVKNLDILISSVDKEDIGNKLPISKNGFLSTYSSDKELIGAELTADEVMAQAIVDLGIFLDADLDDLSAYSKYRYEEVLKH